MATALLTQHTVSVCCLTDLTPSQSLGCSGKHIQGPLSPHFQNYLGMSECQGRTLSGWELPLNTGKRRDGLGQQKPQSWLRPGRWLLAASLLAQQGPGPGPQAHSCQQVPSEAMQ